MLNISDRAYTDLSDNSVDIASTAQNLFACLFGFFLLPLTFKDFPQQQKMFGGLFSFVPPSLSLSSAKKKMKGRFLEQPFPFWIIKHNTIYLVHLPLINFV